MCGSEAGWAMCSPWAFFTRSLTQLALNAGSSDSASGVPGCQASNTTLSKSRLFIILSYLICPHSLVSSCSSSISRICRSGFFLPCNCFLSRLWKHQLLPGSPRTFLASYSLQVPIGWNIPGLCPLLSSAPTPAPLATAITHCINCH